MSFLAIGQWNDEARRQIGRALDGVGIGPDETPHRIVAELPAARLRAYQGTEHSEAPVVLIIAAPFKRAYIWDLLPQVSVVRRCLERGFRAYLLEWLIPTAEEDEFGLAEYAHRLPSAALDVIASETGCEAPLLFGHSLGGTFCAIFASLLPERVGGLGFGGCATCIRQTWRAAGSRRRVGSARTHDSPGDREPAARHDYRCSSHRSGPRSFPASTSLRSRRQHVRPNGARHSCQSRAMGLR